MSLKGGYYVGGSSGSSLLVSDTTLAGAVQSVDFAALDGDTDGGYLLEFMILNSSGAGGVYSIFANADYTATNYYTQHDKIDNAAQDIARNNTSTISSCGNGVSVAGIIFIIRDVSGYLKIRALVPNGATGSAVEMRTYDIISKAAIANITSIRIYCDQANGIGIGSRFILSKFR